MISIFKGLGGSALFARALRGSAFTAVGYALSQLLRLAANLILTRLLFPEAFGLMALVSVFMVGLMMFSDVGLGPSIQQHRRGDEREFLDTAWTIQVLRGGLLWVLTCLIAWPMAQLYEAPQLAQLLPVAGLTLLISGFNPTRIETASRHLALGRVTVLDLASQVLGVLLMIGLSWATGSVWALVWGGVLGALAKLALMHFYLPGSGNRLRWEGAAAGELIRFGKWIFLSTACGFLLAQGDKAILGHYLSLDQLGIYNIGFFLASFPVLLGGAVISRVMIPLYRECGVDAPLADQRRLRRLRFGMTAGLMAMLVVMGFIGVPLVRLLYDPRYEVAGAMVVVIACLQLPQIIGMTYDRAALAAGDARFFFWLTAARAGVQTALFLAGAEISGLWGALIGLGLAQVLIHPLLILLARRHRVWDGWHDLIFALLSLGLGGAALWVNRAAVMELATLGWG